MQVTGVDPRLHLGVRGRPPSFVVTAAGRNLARAPPLPPQGHARPRRHDDPACQPPTGHTWLPCPPLASAPTHASLSTLPWACCPDTTLLSSAVLSLLTVPHAGNPQTQVPGPGLAPHPQTHRPTAWYTHPGSARTPGALALAGPPPSVPAQHCPSHVSGEHTSLHPHALLPSCTGQPASPARSESWPSEAPVPSTSVWQ